jgi:hypothetical protein
MARYMPLGMEQLQVDMGNGRGIVPIGLQRANNYDPLPASVFTMYAPPTATFAARLEYWSGRHEKAKYVGRTEQGGSFEAPKGGWLVSGRVYKVVWTSG